MKNGKIETAVYRKITKLPVSCHQKYLNGLNETQSNPNSILHHSKRSFTNFDEEIYRIKKKFLAADYQQKCIKVLSVILKIS